MRVIHPLKMDLVRPWTGDLLHMVQGDSNTRVVELQLFSDGKEWDIPSADLVTVAFKKPDQTKGFYETSGVIDGNRIQVVLAPQVLTAHGKVTVVVELRNAEGSSLASFPFGIMVAQNPEVDAEASEDYFNYVNPFITEALEKVEAAAQAAREAADNANAASGVADEAKQKAEEANAKVDTLREVVSKFHSNIQETVMGEVITVSDASDLPLAGLKVFGKTEQNGIPEPSAPVALESVGDDGSVEVKVTNRNFMQFPYYNQDGTFSNGVTFNILPDGSVVANGTADREAFFNFTSTSSKTLYLPKGKYTFSGVSSGSYGGSVRPQLWVQNADGSVKFGVYAEGKTVEITKPDYFSVSIDIVKDNALNNFVVKPMINVGETALPFESPIAQQTLTTQTPYGLPGIPVDSGGNYTDPVTGKQWICDEVDFEKGVYVQKVQKITLGGETTIYRETIGGINRFYKKLKDSDVSFPVLCNYFPYGSGTDNVIRFTSDQYAIMYFPKNVTVPTEPEFTNMRKEIPLDIIYVLAEEKTKPLSEFDPDALAQYAALHTNYPNTTVFNDAGAGMEVKYAADTKLYIDQKFNELAAAMVSNV